MLWRIQCPSCMQRVRDTEFCDYCLSRLGESSSDNGEDVQLDDQ